MKENIPLKGSRAVTLFALFSQVIDLCNIPALALLASDSETNVQKLQEAGIWPMSHQCRFLYVSSWIWEPAVFWCDLFTKETLEANFPALQNGWFLSTHCLLKCCKLYMTHNPFKQPSYLNIFLSQSFFLCHTS